MHGIHGVQAQEVAVLVHGFLKSLASSVWMQELSDILLEDESRAVVLVDWGHGSGGLPLPDPFYYYQVTIQSNILLNSEV